MYLKMRDYTVWTKEANGETRYFIKYHGQKVSPTCEISLDVFVLYFEEFNKPLENQRNEQRRHIATGSLDDFDMAGELASRTADDEDKRLTMYGIKAALKTCTPTQQRRFRLHYHEGYTFVEIAKMENCDAEVVRRSVLAARKKIKNFF